MDEIRCSIEVEDREVEGKPTRIVGTLMAFGERAKDRAEVFEVGSLSWPESGIILNRQHSRAAPILRFTPVEVEGRLMVDAAVPDTAAGRDALAELSGPHPLFKCLSIEFRAVRQSIVAGVRRISEAVLTGAGLVDEGAYASAVVEARELAERSASDRHTREFLL